MKKATPAQSEKVRHRRNVVRLMFPIVAILWLIGSIAADSWFRGPLSGVYWIGSFAILMVLVLFVAPQYWRCPVCRSTFPRGSNGAHCEVCGTTFDI
jgi:membrane protein YdbS with pleckstrin-like domain